MEAEFDLEGSVKSLRDFCETVSIHLTDDPPIPTDIARPLLMAHDQVTGVLEQLRRRYGFSEAGWTPYAPKRPADSET